MLVYTIDVPTDDATRIAQNRKRNETLVQTRVTRVLRLVLLRQARKRGVSVSALVAAVLADHFPVAPKARRA